ncbi:MAG: hypothetical protein IKC89_04295 [Lentisphaeria bacterium]|nr:hypothetical protein [Lentisphaeria bacterium]
MSIDIEVLKSHIRLGVQWLTGVATIRENIPCGEKGESFNYTEWRGALRGEYTAATGTWDEFCPYWHTGQGVKALVAAAEVLDEPSLLDDARYCAEFLLANQIKSGDDAGLFPAFEDRCDLVNTSAILESIDGMFKLSDATGDPRYRDAALLAVDWVARKAWQENLGKFFDYYQITSGSFIFGLWGAQNRPLLDDAVFVSAWKLTGNKRYFDIACAIAETLVKEEYPSGNWIKICPCNPETGIIHPRHAYWWGRPMLTMFNETGDQRFLGVFCRSVEWYDKALRRDGGIIRDTGADFRTASFGHATSGSACAALCFMDRAGVGEHDHWMSRAELAIKYCMAMQFTNAADPNLQGAVLEKVCFPDGTDRSPYYLRDLGTIFFIQAAAAYIKHTASC